MLNRHIGVAALVVLLCGCMHIYRIPADVFNMVETNNAYYLEGYLKSGGDPNAVDSHGRSLLYIATGPHGGLEVLELLLKAGADTDKGLGTYTPLMNAAKWSWLEGVKALVEAGADPNRTNWRKQTALDCVVPADGREKPVILYLTSVMASDQSQSQ